MSIRLAAPRLTRGRLATWQVRRLQRAAVNDNRTERSEGDASIRRALELFGRHGLGAAEVAHNAAERAALAGDAAGFAFWRDTCATLDRRLARALVAVRPGQGD